MLRCASCGFNNPETRERCVRCSALLKSQALPDGSHVADARTPLLQGVRVRANEILWRVGCKLGGRLPSGISHRYPWSAAYLSLLPGAGQIYNRQPLKAAIFVVVFMALAGVFVGTIFHPWNNLVLLVLVFWLFYAMADGYVTAARINGDPWGWRQVLAMWFAFMFFLGMTLSIGQFMGGIFFSLVTVRQDNLAPAIRKGDKYFVLGWPFFRSHLGPGSFVFYDPGHYTLRRNLQFSTDFYVVNERNSFGVVTAMPGEIVSCELDGVVRVDGVPVDGRRMPVAPNGVPQFPGVRIPPSQVGILIGHPTSDHTIGLSQIISDYALDTPSPRRAGEGGGWGLEGYEASVQTPADEVHGIILFRYYPPERREWFGWDRGLWTAPPQDYPKPISPPRP